MLGKKIQEKNMIFVIIAVSCVARLALAPFQIMVPNMPHDMYAYIGPAKCMVEGSFPLGKCLSWEEQSNQPAVYGPVLTLMMVPVYLAFGQYDFFMYKFFFIIFDLGNVALVYLLAKKLFSSKAATYISLVYSLSFMPLMNSAVLGNDEIALVFLFLLSSYLLMSKRLFSSAFAYSLTLLMKPFSIVVAPALLFYAYKKYGLKSFMSYAVFGGIVISSMFALFILWGGFGRTLYYFGIGTAGAEMGYTSNLSIFNIIKYLTNLDMSTLAVPVLVISLVATFLLALKTQMKNPEIELFRNIALFELVTLLFGNVSSGIYAILFFPFLLLFMFSQKHAGEFGLKHALGFLAITAGLIVYSAIYREGLIEYSNSNRILLLFALASTFAGEFCLLKGFGKNFRLAWSSIALSSLMFLEVYAAPLLIFPLKYFSRYIDLSRFTVVNKLYGEHIMGRPDLLLAYGAFYAVPALILFLSLAFIYAELLRIKSK